MNTIKKVSTQKLTAIFKAASLSVSTRSGSSFSAKSGYEFLKFGDPAIIEISHSTSTRHADSFTQIKVNAMLKAANLLSDNGIKVYMFEGLAHLDQEVQPAYNMGKLFISSDPTIDLNYLAKYIPFNGEILCDYYQTTINAELAKSKAEKEAEAIRTNERIRQENERLERAKFLNPKLAMDFGYTDRISVWHATMLDGRMAVLTVVATVDPNGYDFDLHEARETIRLEVSSFYPSQYNHGQTIESSRTTIDVGKGQTITDGIWYWISKQY